MKVLVLGGTGEARLLATQLLQGGIEVVTSLAGRLDAPHLPRGAVRMGGFGGAKNLYRFASKAGFSAVIDATHPFAERMTATAAQAFSGSHIPLLRLQRAPWCPVVGDRWIPVGGLTEAAVELARFGDRVLLTIGRQEVAEFAEVDKWFLIRSIDKPAATLPRRHELLLARGPFTVESETSLLADRGIDVVVSKNSGGTATCAKLTAARHLGLPVVMVRRPPTPTELTTVDSVDAALSWIRGIAEA